jgi:hypothetical protein
LNERKINFGKLILIISLNKDSKFEFNFGKLKFDSKFEFNFGKLKFDSKVEFNFGKEIEF